MCSGFGGGISLWWDLSAKSSLGELVGSFGLTPSCGVALDGASENGGPVSAVFLSQELAWESVCELGLLNRQGEKTASHACPAALGPLWGFSGKAA